MTIEDELGQLRKLPMPPTLNKSYAHLGKRRFSTQDLKDFKAGIDSWALENRTAVKSIREKVLASDERTMFKLTLEFKFPHAKLYTLKNHFKKLDVSNRIKAAEDAVTDVLGFDDKSVFELVAVKGHTRCGEHFNVKLSIIENGHSIV